MKHLKSAQEIYKLGENERSSIIPEKEIDNLQLLLSEKKTETEKLDNTKAGNEKIIKYET